MDLPLTAMAAFLLSAILLAFSGISGQFALDKWNEWRAYKTYQYKYFNKERFDLGSDSSGDVRHFLNQLDLAKRKADESFKSLGNQSDSTRLKEINDYTFKIFRDLWFAQKKWLMVNGRYFQGTITMPHPPKDCLDERVHHRFGLTDQVDDWLDMGYADEYAPVQLECHVYDGSSGKGFTVWARFTVQNITWVNQMHVGPEKSRDESNFIWKKTN